MITQERLKQLYDYDQETGLFKYKVVPSRRTGSLNRFGYIKIKINEKIYPAHHLAWLYVYGHLPKMLDHIDRNKSNNRITNLREVTRSENLMNQGIHKNNTSGHRGIDIQRNRFRVYVRGHYLGVYSTLQEALAVRDKYTARFLPAPQLVENESAKSNRF